VLDDAPGTYVLVKIGAMNAAPKPKKRKAAGIAS
jgi:hypothetical protein